MNKFIKHEQVYKKVSFKQDMLCEKGNEKKKELKYFCYKYKKITNLGKLCLILKIDKRIENVPGRPVILTTMHPLKRFQSFRIITLNRLWKVVDLTSKIVETS